MGKTLRKLSEEEIHTRICEFAPLLVEHGFNAGQAALAMGLGKTQGYTLVGDNYREGLEREVLRVLSEKYSSAERVQEMYIQLLDCDIADFESVIEDGMSLKEARRLGYPTWLIKRYRVRYNRAGEKVGADIDLHNKEEALKALQSAHEAGSTTINIGSIQQNITDGADAYEALLERQKMLESPEGDSEVIDVECSVSD